MTQSPHAEVLNLIDAWLDLGNIVYLNRARAIYQKLSSENKDRVIMIISTDYSFPKLILDRLIYETQTKTDIPQALKKD